MGQEHDGMGLGLRAGRTANGHGKQGHLAPGPVTLLMAELNKVSS